MINATKVVNFLMINADPSGLPKINWGLEISCFVIVVTGIVERLFTERYFKKFWK